MNIKKTISITVAKIKATIKIQLGTFLGICGASTLAQLGVLYNNINATLLGTFVFSFLFSFATVYIMPGYLLSNIKLRFSHSKKAIEIPMPIEFIELCEKMNINYDKIKIKIRDDLDNAYVLGKDIVLGKPLLDRLNNENILCILVHEIQHIKGKHRLYTMILSTIPFTFATLGYLLLPPLMRTISVYSATIIFLVLFSWISESRSDKATTIIMGKNATIDTLKKLSKNGTEHSLTHPSIETRIEYIKQLNM